MKQGTGHSTMSGGKTQPRSHGITPAAAAAPGILQTRTRPMAVTTHPGIVAPMAAQTNHPKGSQGKR